MTLARIWRTRIRPERAHDYETFARDVSLPMFSRQQGFRGVLMLGSGAVRSVLTLWDDEAAIAALAQSESYRQTVARIRGEGFLEGQQTVELLEVQLTNLREV